MKMSDVFEELKPYKVVTKIVSLAMIERTRGIKSDSEKYVNFNHERINRITGSETLAIEYAVNNHDALVEALEDICDFEDGAISRAMKLLEKIKGDV